jgi:hypothetical protein
VDHPLHLDRVRTVQQWRTATMVISAVAFAELVLLLVVGGALLVKPANADDVTRTRPIFEAATAPATKARVVSKGTLRPPAETAELPRRKVSVLVLNGNGRQGAAALAASRVQHRGYRVGGVANAPSHTYAHSIVLYRPGFKGETRRLARDLGVRVVSPLDGMRPAQLRGAHAVLILGA